MRKSVLVESKNNSKKTNKNIRRYINRNSSIPFNFRQYHNYHSILFIGFFVAIMKSQIVTAFCHSSKNRTSPRTPNAFGLVVSSTNPSRNIPSRSFIKNHHNYHRYCSMVSNTSSRTIAFPKNIASHRTMMRLMATTTTGKGGDDSDDTTSNKVTKGDIMIYDEQTSIPDIDLSALDDTCKKIAELVGYPSYGVTLLLVDDDEMRSTNLESRGIDRPTDILSFPFHFAVKPGVIEKPEFDIPDYYTLGDMMVCTPYVIRRCEEDAMDNNEHDDDDDGDASDNDFDSDDDGDLEDDDRGVSGAMATIRDPEERIRMLLVHGMLHLIGHDHEEDDEYEVMVQREEEILKELGYEI
mmetsp:Transcript_17449/g.42414  ORF Transcript_17449/g.42414 Transcript_17449/m.42414 type:complete len:353 (+) Transcript_17449:157-1215(+)